MTDHNNHIPCPYCGPVSDLRATAMAQETPEQEFERRYAEERLRALAAEQVQFDADAEEDRRRREYVSGRGER